MSKILTLDLIISLPKEIKWKEGLNANLNQESANKVNMQKSETYLEFKSNIYRQSPIFLLLTKKPLLDKIDLQALYLSETYCHKTDTRFHSCVTP